MVIVLKLSSSLPKGSLVVMVIVLKLSSSLPSLFPADDLEKVETLYEKAKVELETTLNELTDM